jgi:predicted dehydrogenase
MDRTAATAAEFSARAHPDLASLLADPTVDVVLVATPHTTHAELAIQAFRAGKHVLLEKPAAHRLSQALAITDAWREARTRYPELKYGIIFQERMQPAWVLLRSLLAARALGRLIRVTWIDTAWYRTMAYYRTAAWRATWAGEGGGALINQAVHRLDLYGWLFGRPARVRAFGGVGKYHRIETEDEATLLLEHADGMIGHFITSTAEFPGTQRLEIVGEHGRLVLEDGRLIRDRTSVSVLDFIDDNRERFGVPTSVREDVAPGPALVDPHAALFADFIGAVRENRGLAVPGEEGAASVELVNAATLSMHGAGVVGLPLDPAVYDDWLAARIAAVYE